ncbi:MAG TPA: hypothetical protein VJY54_13155 [Lachnospiraceae bacterium]|nr:hypothetical protein [Lachnospiraceae bacterium]
MKASTIFFKTIKFTWLKLALGLATLLVSVLLFAILTGIAMLFRSEEGLGFGVIIWFILSIAAYYIINLYFGYLVKAGHVAIIATAVTTNQIPDQQFEVAKEIVKKRFATSNAYFVIDRLVTGSVSQLQRGLQKIDNLLGNIPGISFIINIMQLFVSIALNYVDECCLGYTFIKTDINPYKAAADGVVIYFQNWKKLLKSAALTSLIVIVATIAAWVIPFFVFGAIFTLLGWSKWIAAILAFMFALAIKSAFIDSYIMISMMVSYMEVAPTTEITFDLYGKLSKLSRKFRDLLNKGATDENPIEAIPQ